MLQSSECPRIETFYFLLLDLFLLPDLETPLEDFFLPLELLLLDEGVLDLREEDLAFFLSSLDNKERLFSDASTLDPLATEKARKVAIKSTPLKVMYAFALNLSIADPLSLVYPLA